MNPFEKLALELKRLQTGYREESYYRSLCEFLEAYGSGKQYLHMIDIAATSNPNSESVAEGAGFPDIELRQNRRLIGYIEVKPPTQNLDNPSFAIQFNRYKEAFENIVFTNFKKWILYTWDKDGKPQKTAEAEWDLETDLSAETLKKLLTVFFEGSSYEARTPHQLALALARKTKLLRNQVENAVTEESPSEKLLSLKKTFEGTLIQNISDHQFANIYAETIAYALFLAKLEHFEKGSNVDFTLRTAVDFLPKNVPIFKDLYQLTGGRVEPITPEIYKATEILIEQLNYADIERIYKKLVEHKPGEDPVIQFYEPFLAEYDPKEREARGVYYTPKPVVDYIVRSVDYILKTKFKKPKGLGDESLQILDPATGTGTFLMSVIQNIYADIEKKNKPLGENLVKRKFNEVVSNHILKHLYGFELLVAPYAIAHLKLTLELERLGFNFSITENDQDKENDRLKIFLANTLDDPNQPPQSLFGFESITEESEKARIVKKETPILVILGNPPYSISSGNKGKWIEDQMKVYKEDVSEERNIQLLSDDYAKFIRFCHWKIEKTGSGVISMITKNTYLSVSAFLGLRKKLLTYFDEVYILNLHGKQYEKLENGIPDENVFSIRVGVAIITLVKNNTKKGAHGNLYSADVLGSQLDKFAFLNNSSIEDIKWKKLLINEDKYFFEDKNLDTQSEYEKYISITDIFDSMTSGVTSGRDNFISDIDKETLRNRLNSFINSKNNTDELKQTFDLTDSTNISVNELKKKLLEIDESLFIGFCFKPFTKRIIYYDREIIDRDRYNVMKNFINLPNLGFTLKKSYIENSFQHIFVVNGITDKNFLNGQTYIVPLFLQDGSQQQSLIDDRSLNLNLNKMQEIASQIGLDFSENGGDLVNTFGPLDFFYYCYAILHNPNYRLRYAQHLQTDFPRIPITGNSTLFKKLLSMGKDLVNLHLLGNNPFNKDRTIFDDTSKWSVSIGGEKPENSDDWKVIEVRYDEKTKRVYINPKQYFEGIEKEVWGFMIGGYQILDKWLKDRKKAERVLSPDDQIHYMKVVVSLRETIRIMRAIDEAIPEWPIK